MTAGPAQWLDAAELVDLTGYKRYTAQRAWLDHNEIPFFVAASGRPIVKRVDLDPASAPPEPETSALDGPWVDLGICAAEWIRRNAHALYVGREDLACRATDWKLAPVDPGIYFLFDDARELLYVGRSVTIGSRLVQHRHARRIPFVFAAWVIVPSGILDTIERHYLRWAPPYNVRCVGAR